MGPQISLLGGYALLDAEGRSARLPTRKSWALLAYLSMSHGRDVPREELAALLWPRSSDANARASLRQELAVLRKAAVAAGLPPIESTKERVCFDLPDPMVDARQMARLIEEGGAEAGRRAVDCYGGDFLAGLNILSHPFEDWLWVERLRLKALVQGAYLKLLEQESGTGDPAAAIATAKALLAIEPTQEQGHRALMRLFARAGRRAEALKQFQRCADVLERELDTEPSRETVELAGRIRADLEGARRNGTGSRADGAQGVPPVRPLRAPLKPATHTLILMVADLAGVEGLYSRLDPRRLAEAQDRFVDLAAHQVVRSGGQVLAGSNDGVLACFGYPDLTAEDLDRALHAAQEIAAKIYDVSDESALGPRVGVARGKVLVRADAHGHAQIVGIALRQAQTLAQAAKTGDVVISADLRSRIGVAFETEDVPVAGSRDTPATDRGYLVRADRRAGS